MWILTLLPRKKTAQETGPTLTAFLDALYKAPILLAGGISPRIIYNCLGFVCLPLMYFMVFFVLFCFVLSFVYSFRWVDLIVVASGSFLMLLFWRSSLRCTQVKPSSFSLRLPRAGMHSYSSPHNASARCSNEPWLLEGLGSSHSHFFPDFGLLIDKM